MPVISPEELRRLSSCRWFIPILAQMAVERGVRFTVLAGHLSVSKSVLSQNLDRLDEMGLISRNPGHGHPLRPEYLLTERGRPLADWSRTIVDQHRRLDIAPSTLGRWSLPLLAHLGEAPKRFSVLQRELAPITPRALSLELVGLRSIRLINRVPPQPLYSLTNRGLRLAQMLAAP